ncbi:MAG TPA: hypothetical protein VHW71_08910 [Steroidobacteraceae bacterium]|jgi:hypothetical protein|nr:hypothetical protein [Steroidobacteraceae bacterium]
MATTKITTPKICKAAAIPSKQRPRRASQRAAVISIDLSGDLRNLMIEQCRDGLSYITVYQGSRGALLAAGVPAAAFPVRCANLKFQVLTLHACCTGSEEILNARMRKISDDGFELEIDWGTVKPYNQASHPAISELARMLLKDVLRWTRTDYEDNGRTTRSIADLSYPIDTLAADARAVDYKPRPGAPRVQVTPEFNERLHAYASWLHHWIFEEGEVMPCAPRQKQSANQPGTLKLVVDNTLSAVQP